MRVWIDQDQCTGSGLCELIEPQVFVVADDGLARVRHEARVLPPRQENTADVPVGCEDRVREASQSCPGGCIQVRAGDRLPGPLGDRPANTGYCGTAVP
jgi:ferredoxin